MRFFMAPATCLFLLVCMLLAASDGFAAQHVPHDSAQTAENKSLPFDIKVFGNFMQMMHSGDYGAKVMLKDIAPDKGLYAVGALSGLRGEISIINGKRFVSIGNTDSSSLLKDASGEHAALLVSARVWDWKTVVVPENLDQAGFENFVVDMARQNGIDVSQPFPFLVAGSVLNLQMHVVAGAPPAGLSHGADAHGPQFEQSASILNGQLVGFYSGAALSGVISHPGERFHVHMVDSGQSVSAHVDAYGVAKGAVLSIPSGKEKSSAANTRTMDGQAEVSGLGHGHHSV